MPLQRRYEESRSLLLAVGPYQGGDSVQLATLLLAAANNQAVICHQLLDYDGCSHHLQQVRNSFIHLETANSTTGSVPLEEQLEEILLNVTTMSMPPLAAACA
jgi:hypothetical protein